MATPKNRNVLSAYSYAWITLGLFLFSLAGHWIFGWFEYLSDQAAHQQPVQVGEYAVKMARGTLENWQSEFLQLLWQVGGLAMFLYVGSPQSKEGDAWARRGTRYPSRRICSLQHLHSTSESPAWADSESARVLRYVQSIRL